MARRSVSARPHATTSVRRKWWRGRELHQLRSCIDQQINEGQMALMLPASIQSITVIRNAGVPRYRTTQTFSKYRRFTTKGRLVR